MKSFFDTFIKLVSTKADIVQAYYEHKFDILDRQIDSEVFKLYKLTEEEIKIVEGN